METRPAAPLGAFDAVLLIVGIVIGAGIFALPAMVAANTGTPGSFAFAWILGGVISLAGALCYAELATAYPHAGGEHHFLRRAFGPMIGFLFGWSRLAVLQTGAIAMQGFIIGDYLARMLPLGEGGAAVYAAATVIVITAVNLVGLREGKWTQLVLASATCLGVLLVAVTGLFAEPVSMVAASEATSDGRGPAFGLAMVFVLLAFGGWNEAAYISADVSRQNMIRSLVIGIATITAIYLLVNFAYLRGLGLEDMAASKAVAADLVERVGGPAAAGWTSAVIAVAALSTMNATAITGGRSNLALGREVPLFAGLGELHGRRQTPRNALLVQGAIALLLVQFGASTRDGFVALVEYTAPVFWFFIFLVGCAVFVLRRRDPSRLRPFRVPLYPVTPLVFCGVCLYMIQSSLAHTGLGALVGVAVLLVGLPVWWLARAEPRPTTILKPKEIHS